MAKYDVEYGCGHTGEVALFGQHSERERKIAWLGTQRCPECLGKERSEVAAHMADYDREVLGLPDLVGSDKQLVWATQIRHHFFADVAKLEQGFTERATNTDPEHQKSAALAEQMLFELDTIVEPLKRADRAIYWIEHKDELTYSALQNKLRDVAHGLADGMQQLVVSDIGLSAADARDILRLSMEQKRRQLEERRASALQAAQQEQQTEAEKMAAKNRAIWEKKDKLAQAIHAVIGDQEATLSTWYKDGTEKRIYCDVGYGKYAKKTCLYVTGNRRMRPGAIEGNEALRPALELCGKEWNHIRITITPDGKAK